MSKAIPSRSLARRERGVMRGARVPATLALASCLLLLLWALPVAAQKSSGQINGAVVDQNGAAVPEATVTIVQVGTGLKREVRTSDDGLYSVPDLPIGTYRVSVVQTGFKESVADGVVVNVATITRQDFSMQVGEVGERVEVVANEIQVETETGAIGEVVSGEQVRELPLNGRSFVQLTQLQPGVSPASNFDSKNKGLFSGVDFSVNGNNTQSNLFLTDGANNNDTGSNRTILLYPSIEAIAEFKMLRNSYGPEYGQASGAVISIVTRGGQNEFHGSLFYFGRNDKLNAADFFVNRTGGTKDKLRRNDFGGSIGGPIVRDRFFFFFSQEWNKEIRGFTRFGSVPTLAERRGDFSQPRFVGTTRCSGPPIGNGRPGEATQIIPEANLSPAGLAIVNLYPEPNFAGPDCNNWRESTNAPIDFRESNIRFDYKPSNAHQIFGRYTQDWWDNPAPLLLPAGLWGDDPFTGIESSWSQPSRQVALKLTSTLGGAAVNEVQFSYSANRIHVTPGIGGELNSQINATVPSFFPESGKTYGVDRPHPVFWGGIAPFNSNRGPDLWTASPFNNSLDIYSFRDDFSKVKGNQTMKAGFLFETAAKDEDTGGSGASEVPQFWGACCGNNSGNYLADVLTRGSRLGFNETNIVTVAETRYKNIEFYFGDTWKVRTNLTLELGARWSFLREPYDARDEMSAFDPRLYDPTRPASDPCNGLVVPPGTNPCASIPGASTPREGVNRALRENNNHLIAPRLGIAWDPWGNGRTAIRAGVGQFFQRERVGPLLGLAGQVPFAVGVAGERTLDGDVIIIGGPASGQPTRAWDPSNKVPNTWQWNLTVDQQLWKDAVLEVGYVGNRAVHQLTNFDINQPLPANRLQAAFINTADQPSRDLRPFRNFSNILMWARAGSASYHSLQTLFKTRLGGRSQLQMSYTWSHSIADAPLDDSSGAQSANTRLDTYDGTLERGNSGINRPHIFVANAIFYLPEFKGSSNFVRTVLGGWEYATIVTLSSGSSLTPNITNGSIPNLPGGLSGIATNTGNERPNRVEGVPCRVGDDPLQIINPAAFTLVGARIGQRGNSGRGVCLGPGTNNFDMSFYKNFTPGWLQSAFGEEARVQFRFELFNAFNHAQFAGNSVQLNISGGPVTCGGAACSPTNNLITAETKNGAFGRAGATRGPREIQYSLKLVF